jgi:hypothetical protein
MLRSRSLLVQPTSGFVPFAGGASADGLFDADARAATWAAPAPAATTPREGMRRALWAPGSSSHVRRVEAMVLASVCGYFTFGLGKLLGLL